MQIRQAVVEPSIQLITMNEQDNNDLNMALSRIKSLPAGEALLNEIRENTKNGKVVKIQVNHGQHGHTLPALTDKDLDKVPPDRRGFPSYMTGLARSKALKKGAFKGEGASADVYHNPNILDVSRHRRQHWIGPEHFHHFGLENNDPTLFNTLVTALRILKGTYRDDGSIAGHEDEVLRAIGEQKHINSAISENMFREQLSVPMRAYMPEETNVNFTGATARPGIIQTDSVGYRFGNN